MKIFLKSLVFILIIFTITSCQDSDKPKTNNDLGVIVLETALSNISIEPITLSDYFTKFEYITAIV